MANPVNRKEAILAGENVAPVTREEYFVKEAVSNGGGGGNPGYHVETENLGTLIPQQTVTTTEMEGLEEGIFAGSVTIIDTPPEGITEPPETIKVVFDGVTYLCPFEQGSDFIGAQISEEDVFDFSVYPFSLTAHDAGMLITPTSGTHTVQGDWVNTEMVIDPEFEEAVNTVVGDSGGSSQSELPDYSGKGRYTLVTDARGEHISWSNLAYTDGGSAGLYTSQRNYYTKNAFIHVHGSISQIKQNITAGWFSGMKQYTTATLALYSTNGLELVYQIDPTNNPNLIYDKGTESPANVTVQGDVVIVTNS